MSLSAGFRLGPYEIASPLGQGGMGAVYRATDTRLNRTVAIKAMHATGALDPDHVARFEREAQLLASLNHPNIAAIHGLETVDATTYLVLEFVDGRPLSEVLRDGALPLSEALPIARQIADALAATHERGIIHRDLKPGNIMVTPDGQVKVLDFGLGKTLDSAPGTPDQANSPTMTMAATQAGIILGTAGYMSPEQAKGRNADKRSDVWAFGCVLFEMLSGRRAFEGEDITETLAAIVRGEPEWAALPATTPPAIRTLIERCLIKNRADRLPDMSVVKFVLNEPAVLGQPLPAVARPASSRLAWMVAGAATGLAVLSGALWVAQPGPVPPVAASLTIDLPDGDFVPGNARLPLAISPDGTHVAYSGFHSGKLQLLVRALDDPQPRVLEGTDGAEMPFFDPTGRWVAFFAQGQLKKIAVGGSGLSVITGDVPYPRGGTWGAGDIIYLAPGSQGGIYSVPASGGSAQAVTELDAASGEITHRWPQILPDGKTLLFTAWTGPGLDERNVAVQSLGAAGHRVIVRGAETGRYVDGYLLYGRLDNLFAVPWKPGQDLGSVEPVELAQHVRGDSEGHAYAVSGTGTLVYLQGSPRRYENRVVWVDRSGRAEALQVSPGNFEVVALAPDGDKAIVQRNGGLETLWMYDVLRGTLAPFLTPEGSSQSPVWTPDGQYIIYRGTRAGRRNMYRKRADGVGGVEPLTNEPGVTQTPVSVSPDGRWLVFAQSGGSGASDLLALDLTAPAGSPARPVANLPATEGSGRVSPDGRWIAYVSTKSGRPEIYVQAFPEPGPVYTVSTDGGNEPVWSRDGRELYYVPLSGDGIMVANVTLNPFKATQPRVLFTGYYKPSIHQSAGYDVSRDGRFLRVQPTHAEGTITRLAVVLHWLAGVGARTP